MDEVRYVIIREAVVTDLPALEWDGEYRRFRRLYQKAMMDAQEGRQILLVAESEGEIVGQIFIQLTSITADPKRERGTAYFYSFRVKPDFRNKGVGSLLITSAEAAAHEKGFKRTLIGVVQTNLDAQRLYSRLGYNLLVEDPGEWSFIDDQGKVQHIVEPTFIMEKYLTTG